MSDWKEYQRKDSKGNIHDEEFREKPKPPPYSGGDVSPGAGVIGVISFIIGIILGIVVGYSTGNFFYGIVSGIASIIILSLVITIIRVAYPWILGAIVGVIVGFATGNIVIGVITGLILGGIVMAIASNFDSEFY
ncbi:MAG: hypothetical protein FWG77_03120 [Treponema sp.]|nr:hypothetical protein [Treponema sp.]